MTNIGIVYKDWTTVLVKDSHRGSDCVCVCVCVCVCACVCLLGGARLCQIFACALGPGVGQRATLGPESGGADRQEERERRRRRRRVRDGERDEMR